MGNNKPNNFMWLAIGSAVGAFVCYFFHTEKGKEVKKDIMGTMANIAGRTEDIAEVIKDKVMKAYVKTSGKTADAASEISSL